MMKDTLWATAHIAVLSAILTFSLYLRLRNSGLVVCALFVLLWTDIVLTALALGAMGRLGQRNLYVCVSLLLALLAAWAVERQPAQVPAPPGDAPPTEWNLIAYWASWLAIVATIVPTVLIGCFYQPNNYDSVAYRLPRAILYIGQGSLGHLPDPDPRVAEYPFNMALAYLLAGIHRLAGAWFNVFGIVAWLVGGVAVKATAREIGASRVAALLSAALFLTTPAVLISASSTNDDMIAGVPVAVAVLFGLRWWRSFAWLDCCLAAASLGLAIGCKPHMVFYLPYLAAIAVLAVSRPLATKRFVAAHVPQLLVSGSVAALIGLPSFLINLLSTGHLTPDYGLLNSPFRIVTAVVHSSVASAHLFLAQIPDLYLEPGGTRQIIFDNFNNFFNERIFFWVRPDLHYSTEPYYYFDGVAARDGVTGLWEQSAWLGFVPWLLLASVVATAVTVRRSSGRFSQASFWLGSSLFIWHLTRCTLMKYIGTAGIYYAFPMGVAAPALAALWDKAAERRVVALSSKLGCLLVLATNVIFAADTFAYNPERNLVELWNSGFSPHKHEVDQSVADVIRTSRHILISHTHWELPLFQLMSLNPKARYESYDSTAVKTGSSVDLTIMLAREIAAFGDLPIRLAHDDRERFSIIGRLTSGYGSEFALARKSPAQPKAPPSSATPADYVMLTFTEKKSPSAAITALTFGSLYGADADEAFEMRITQVSANGTMLPPGDWVRLPSRKQFDLPQPALDGHVVVDLLKSDRPDIAGSAILPLAPGGKVAP